MVQEVQQNYAQMLGAQMAQDIANKLLQPQSIFVDGKDYRIALRPERHYFPFSLTLLKATHTVYDGTVTSQNPEGIPKDFRSRVRLQNPVTHEDREVEIYMNTPLRYAGLTFYQYQMTAGELVDQNGGTPSTVLQIVHNPSWVTPYLGCALVAAGLATQFLFHLVGFISKRKIQK
jgi:cytochrome c biogenesis protein ResB